MRRTYYVNVGGIIGPQTAAVADFIDSAHGRGCAVELLFGAPEWALTANHSLAVNAAKAVRDLAESQEMAYAMDTVLEAVMARYSPDAAFFGTAVHHYESYLTLKP